MEQPLLELQETLYHEIPLTRFIGITVQDYTSGALTLAAPLSQNINHKQTAFAGSLNAVATLAGWGQIWLLLQELNLAGKIVIQDSSTSYNKPVQQDFIAICHRPAQPDIDRLAKTLRQKGRARMELQVEIRSDATTAVTFTGRYVILGV
ncbi:MAG: thioesterase domain-containing protein [Ktedonobacteraceae bacterium]|nr:thioesterase domain-containing protein [Ktedonobacteraceae bacterium]